MALASEAGMAGDRLYRGVCFDEHMTIVCRLSVTQSRPAAASIAVPAGLIARGGGTNFHASIA